MNPNFLTDELFLNVINNFNHHPKDLNRLASRKTHVDVELEICRILEGRTMSKNGFFRQTGDTFRLITAFQIMSKYWVALKRAFDRLFN